MDGREGGMCVVWVCGCRLPVYLFDDYILYYFNCLVTNVIDLRIFSFLGPLLEQPGPNQL